MPRTAWLACLGLLAPVLSFAPPLQGPRRGLTQRLAPEALGDASFPLVTLAETTKTWLDTAIENRLDSGVSGLLGGSFGVIATLVGYEKRRFKTLERVKCSYCEGSGFLPCATCYGAESLVVPEDPTARALLADAAVVGDGECLCPTCSGAGAVVCCNCKSEGLSMPGQLIKNLAVDSGDLEEIMAQVSVAGLQADFEMERAKQKKRMLLDRKARAALRATGQKVDGPHAVVEVPLGNTTTTGSVEKNA